MGSSLRRITVTALVAASAVLCADEAAQRRLGDAAFYAGDYRNAISSYTSALVLADRENDPDGWAASALNLGVAYLHNGNIAGARLIYDEFRRRYPLRSAGTLPGDLLAAEGKYQEAEEFFRALLKSDPQAADATSFSLAAMYMKTGQVEKACRIFGELAKKQDSPWHISAINENIYALIRLGRYPDAIATVGSIPVEKRNADVELLLYLAEVNSGNIANLKKNFREFLDKMPPVPHVRLMELLSRASDEAYRKKDYRFAVDALRGALGFASDPAVKQQLHRQLIKILLPVEPEKEVSEVLSYLRLYPDASDRMDLLLYAANKLHEKQLYAPALELYYTGAAGNFTMDEKVRAVSGAVTTAEAVKDFAALKRCNDFLNANLPLSAQLPWQLRYAAFLEKNGKKDQALAKLSLLWQQLADAKLVKEAERAALELMNFHLRNKDLVSGGKWADKLEKSSIPAYAAAAAVVNGRLLESQTRYESAREKFLAAVKAGDTETVPEAKFMAALMAYKSFDYPAAAAEFADCAVKFPEFFRAPEALFMAADIYSSINNTVKADAAADLLQQKYPRSQALAALVLRNASERGYSGDHAGAVRELEELEKNFKGAPVAEEAMLLRAVFLDKSGDSAGAMALFKKLHNSSRDVLRAESMLRSSDILFRQEKLSEAKAGFLAAAAAAPGTVFSDIAAGRAGDCDLAGKTLPAPDVLSNCAANFLELAKKTAFPQLRLQAYCKAGIANEQAGKAAEALKCYEQTIYAAQDMINQGLIPEPQWCVRSCEAALHILAVTGESGALQRGLRLIERTGSLMIPEPGFAVRMKDNFRKQLKQRR